MKKIKINYLQGDTVAQIILDDGKGNVLDYVMMESLQNLFEEFKDKPELKLITFEGAGKHFSFGASVEEHRKDTAPAMLNAFHQLFYSLKDLSIPTAAKISGQCLGGGLELAIMCNFLFADKTAKFGQPEIILGVFPPPASIILAEKIGLARAEELLITGKIITSEQAKSIGLVNEVFEDKTTMNTGVNDWAEENILSKSALSLRYGVKAARVKFNHVLGNFLPMLENIYLNQLMETHDANEGIAAFIEKRQPQWQNS